MPAMAEDFAEVSRRVTIRQKCRLGLEESTVTQLSGRVPVPLSTW